MIKIEIGGDGNCRSFIYCNCLKDGCVGCMVVIYTDIEGIRQGAAATVNLGSKKRLALVPKNSGASGIRIIVA